MNYHEMEMTMAIKFIETKEEKKLKNQKLKQH